MPYRQIFLAQTHFGNRGLGLGVGEGRRFCGRVGVGVEAGAERGGWDREGLGKKELGRVVG